MMLCYIVGKKAKEAAEVEEKSETAEEIIQKLKVKKSSIKFSSDFIIGYPGETRDDFMKTVGLMNKVEFINSFLNVTINNAVFFK